MIDLFFLLASVLYFFLIVFYSDYAKVIVANHVVNSVAFIGPFLYYSYLGGQAYLAFGDEAYCYFKVLGLYVLLLCSVEILLRNIYFESCVSNGSLVLTNGLSLFVFLIFLFVFIYVLKFFESFPLVNIALGSYSGVRPDTDGGIPYYFTYTLLASCVLPIAYFLHNNTSKYIGGLLFLCVSFFLLVGGNKGLFLFFVIFSILIDRSFRDIFSAKVIALIVSCFCVYFIIVSSTDASYGVEKVDYYDVFSSALRRFFVTQGAGLINMLDLYFSGYEQDIFSEKKLENIVYEKVYGDKYFGSMPAHFIGGVVFYLGLPFAVFSYFVYIAFLSFVSCLTRAFVDYRAVSWPLYMSVYYVGMGGLSVANLYRVCFVFALFFLFFLLARKKYA